MSEKRMCRFCGRDGTARSMTFYSGGVYGECHNVQACEKRRIAGDRKSDRDESGASAGADPEPPPKCDAVLAYCGLPMHHAEPHEFATAELRRPQGGPGHSKGGSSLDVERVAEWLHRNAATRRQITCGPDSRGCRMAHRLDAQDLIEYVKPKEEERRDEEPIRAEFRCVVCGKARRQIELRLDYAGAYRCRDTCWASAGADPEPRTEAGRHLLRDWKRGNVLNRLPEDGGLVQEQIARIEAEARAQGGPSPEPCDSCGKRTRLSRCRECFNAALARAQGGPSPDVRDVLLEFGQWLADNRTRLTDLQEAIEEDEPDLFIEVVDTFAARLGVAPEPPEPRA